MTLSFLCLVSLLILIIVVVATPFAFILYARLRRRFTTSSPISKLSVAFLHPRCSSGGGGERVLWCAVKHILSTFHNIHVVIYTHPQAAPSPLASHSIKSTDIAILEKVKSQFGADFFNGLDLTDLTQIKLHHHNHDSILNSTTTLSNSLSFSIISLADAVDPAKYPVLTILGQAIGGGFMTLLALLRFTPHIFIDTTGIPFSLPIARYLFGCKTFAYVHYPTISSDMIRVVSSRKAQFNNRPAIARSSVFSILKLWYYRLFSCFYSFAGRSCHKVMVNSTWTQNHIQALWGPRAPYPSSPVQSNTTMTSTDSWITTVFPPCGSLDSSSMRATHARPSHLVVSVAQFRPEKNHALQLDAFAIASARGFRGRLIMIGGAPSLDDQKRVDTLKDKASQLGFHVDDNPQGTATILRAQDTVSELVPNGQCNKITNGTASESVHKNTVHFMVNASRELLHRVLELALVGIHTMNEEHFGINVVEMMAAGVLMIGHNSGGVAADIITHKKDGFLATTSQEYADALCLATFSMCETDRQAMRQAALISTSRFSDEKFASAFSQVIGPYLAA